MTGPAARRATLIVVEGIDGSGKTTLGRGLHERLVGAGHDARWYPNRNLAPVRTALDDVARERGFTDRFAMLGRDEAQFLAAVLKWDDLVQVTADLATPGLVLVLDRYVATHLALARVAQTANGPRLRRLFATLPEPDLTILLDLPATLALERVNARGTDTNTLAFLERFAQAYRQLAAESSSFVTVAADRPADEVLAEAVALAVAHLGEPAG